jgi:adenosylcobinamide kinase/adenosylcobinamide-phosphate guanylyltransferase
MSLILVTGGSRSGKSQFAEKLAIASALPVIYVATGLKPDPQQDPEWAERVQQHVQRRPPDWQTVESGLDWGSLREAGTTSEQCYLIDSLGGWVAAGLDWDPEDWQRWTAELVTVLTGLSGQVIVVAEEVGSGLVPAYPQGRLFRDRIGSLAQQVGSHADAVYWVTAGFAVNLREIGQSVV